MGGTEVYLFSSLSELDGDQGTGQVMLLQPHADGEHALQAGGGGLWQKHIKAWKRGIAQGVNIKGTFKDEAWRVSPRCTTDRKAKTEF